MSHHNTPTAQLSQDILAQLVACRSLSPNDSQAQQWIRTYLTSLGFQWCDYSRNQTTNTWAWLGQQEHVQIIYAGHTDVVPCDNQEWHSDPFTLEKSHDMWVGRGVADMKGSIAAFLAMLPRLIKEHPDIPLGLIFTSDEEGPATDGTCVVVDALIAQGLKPKHILIGEPSCQDALGDGIRIGRRGSIHYTGTINGLSGHSAYPEKTRNPIDTFIHMQKELNTMITQSSEPLPADSGFPDTHISYTGLNAEKIASNVTPNQLHFSFNLRFHPWCDIDTVIKLFHTYAQDHHITGSWTTPSRPFGGQSSQLTARLVAAIQSVCGLKPYLNAGGGTSDGRFLAQFACEIAEFGHINQTIHQANEAISITDQALLCEIYYLAISDLHDSLQSK